MYWKIVVSAWRRVSRVLRQARRLFPFVELERLIGDAGYQGPKMAATVARTGIWKMQIVRRCDRHLFVMLPKIWIVEHHCPIAAAFVRMAMIHIMLRWLAAKPSA